MFFHLNNLLFKIDTLIVTAQLYFCFVNNFSKMLVVLNIYEHILVICIQTKNILMDAAYAEQEPL